MAILRDIKDAMLRTQRETEFSVETGDFSNLTIRTADGFHYFFESPLQGPLLSRIDDVLTSPRLRFARNDV